MVQDVILYSLPFIILFLLVSNIVLNKKLKTLEKKLFIITNNMKKENFAREKEADKRIKMLSRQIDDIKVSIETEKDGGSLKKLFNDFLDELIEEE